MSGELFGLIDTGSATHKLRLVSYISGQPLEEVPMDVVLAQEFGRQLALLGQAMRGFSHAGESPVLLWDLQRVVELRELQSHIDDAQVQQSVQRAIDDFEKRVTARMTALPTQVIHGDANPENVLIDPESRSFTGFIDFSDAIRAPRVFDVAIAASYLRSGGDDPLAFMASFVGAYNAMTRLQDDEVALMFDLVRARLATTITLLYWRLSARDENDPYRQKTLRLESGAADFLAVLEDLGQASFTEQIVRQL
jgi:Ser/Thr protein kinase RdoA (MazF antagonist)